MSEISSLLLLLLLPRLSGAIRIPVYSPTLPRHTSQNRQESIQRRDQFSDVAVNFTEGSTSQDKIYLGNVIVAGSTYQFQLDTGSSDFWVGGSALDSISGITVLSPELDTNITYGTGWAAGPISTAKVEFGGYTVSNQALLKATSSQNPVFSYGASGIFGLGLPSLSQVQTVYRNANSGSTTGDSFLARVWNQNPTLSRFISFTLTRTTDPKAADIGEFTIGEYISEYSSIETTPELAVTQATDESNSGQRWNTVMGGLHVNGAAISLSTQSTGLSSGAALALLDSGTSFMLGPTTDVESIMSNVEGAKYSSSIGLYTVPCTSLIDVSIDFGNRTFSLDPLDLNIDNSANFDLTDCVATIQPQTPDGGPDWILGDAALKSFYSLYNYGTINNSTGESSNTFIQLVSTTNSTSAIADFNSARSTSYNTTSANPSYATTNGTTGETTGLSHSTANDIKNWFTTPHIIAVAAAGAALILIIAVLIAGCVRRSRRRRMFTQVTTDGFGGGFVPPAAFDDYGPGRQAAYTQLGASSADVRYSQSSFARDGSFEMGRYDAGYDAYRPPAYSGR